MSTYVAWLRGAVAGAIVAVAVLVTVGAQGPLWAEETPVVTPGECRQAPPTGHMRFNVCANLDASRVEVRN